MTGAAVLAVLTGTTPALAAPSTAPAEPPVGPPVICAPAGGPASAARAAQEPAHAPRLLAALFGAVVADPAPTPPIPAAAPPPCVPTGTPAPPTGDPTSAAVLLGWGTPTRDDEFNGTALGRAWGVYNGPGHAGNGRRTPRAVTVANGIMTITGDARGNTAGMEWSTGQRYGRWEGRVRAPASDPSYDALMLLWPDAENFPKGGEVDFMEMMDPTRQRTNAFLHYGRQNRQLSGSVRIDATQWHNWAVEWTPTHIATFVDGRQWWRTDRVDALPPGPMHLCIQLDWFPHSARGPVRRSTMQVDWVKQYRLGPGTRATSAADASAVTGDGSAGGDPVAAGSDPVVTEDDPAAAPGPWGSAVRAQSGG